MENLVPDEQPPSWMWPFEDELESWFDKVDKERKERYGGDRNSDEEPADMMQNELTKGRGR